VSEDKQKERQERLARMMQQLAVSYDTSPVSGTPPASNADQRVPPPSPAPAATSDAPTPTSAGSSPAQYIESLSTSMADRKAALRAQRKREMEAELERKYASSPSKPLPVAKTTATTEENQSSPEVTSRSSQ
jgi:hypothetical protein